MAINLNKIRDVVSRVHEEAMRNPELFDRAKRDPEAVLREHGLTDAEINADPGSPSVCPTFATTLSERLDRRF